MHIWYMAKKNIFFVTLGLRNVAYGYKCLQSLFQYRSRDTDCMKMWKAKIINKTKPCEYVVDHFIF